MMGVVRPPRGTGREAILAAATALFADQGYAGTSLREIARTAGVDAALVIRHFGSKEQLFGETMRTGTDVLFAAGTPVDELGEHIVRAVIDPHETLRARFLGLVRASDTGGIASVLREMHEEGFVRPLVEILHGADAETRARLIASLVGGLMYSLWIVEDEPLRRSDPDVIVRTYGPLIQALIDPAAG